MIITYLSIGRIEVFRVLWIVTVAALAMRSLPERLLFLIETIVF